MVEIKRVDPSKPTTLSEEDQKYRLLYSKSRVYVNPTAYARDNIPGFLALVKRVRVCHRFVSSVAYWAYFRRLLIQFTCWLGFLNRY